MTLKLTKEQIEQRRKKITNMLLWPENIEAVNTLCDQALLAITLTQQVDHWHGLYTALDGTYAALTQQLKDKEAEMVRVRQATIQLHQAACLMHSETGKMLHLIPGMAGQHRFEQSREILLKGIGAVEALAATPTQGVR